MSEHLHPTPRPTPRRKLYVGVFLALLVLTALTVWAADQ